MNRPSRVRVKGPLEPYVDGFRQQLAGQGYSPWTAIAHMQLMAQVSCWLAAHRLGAGALTAAGVASFLQDRRASGQARRLSPRGLVPLLGYLRGLGVAPEPTPPVPQSPLDQLLEHFAAYLVAERGLAEATVISYRSVAARFLDGRSPAHGVDLGELTAGEVSAFVAAECGRRSVGSVNNVVTALRALLRFLHVQGHTATSLATAAPTAPGWRGGGMPRALAAGQVARLLASCDRRTAAGRRDYAILVMLTRLGLRAGEVAMLAVDDVDWRAGEILIPGKGNRHELLPLPVDVGQAVADYCQRGRHRGSCRSLFVHVRAPYAALSSSAVSAVVVRACDRAGLPRVGAHRLRHTAATAMRRAGAPLLEIGQVLRHHHAATTALYAADDQDALTAVARRWPGGAA